MSNKIKDENELIAKAVRWAVTAIEEIHKAGGAPRVLNYLGDEAVATFVRNDINIKHTKIL